MLNRLSANALLKSVIVALAAVAVVLLGVAAWNSWQRVATAARILEVSKASGAAFTAMHTLRIDRNQTVRALNAPDPIDAPVFTRVFSTCQSLAVCSSPAAVVALG